MAFPHDGKKFRKGTSGNPRGRTPRLLSAIVGQLKEQGYERATATNVVEAFETLMNVPETELKRIANAPDAPIALKIVGNAMTEGKAWEVLNAMLDRTHGKPKQSMDMVASVNPEFKGFADAPDWFWADTKERIEEEERKKAEAAQK